jgi:hypothetical protein
MGEVLYKLPSSWGQPDGLPAAGKAGSYLLLVEWWLTPIILAIQEAPSQPVENWTW